MSRRRAQSSGEKRPCMRSEHDIPPTLGLVLAGGLARRMGGGDKAFIRIGGATILDRVLASLSAQCAGIAINANGDPERFCETGAPILAETFWIAIGIDRDA